MNLKIKTVVLQEMLSKAIKGAGNNKLIPITGLLGIRQDSASSVLCLTTTDMSNYLYVQMSNESAEDFSVTVSADTFAKLISKMTCETVSLEIKDAYLEIVGNGTYKIELPLDENGELIKYPDPIGKLSDSQKIDTGTIDSYVFGTISNSIKPALSVTSEVPCYMSYYVGDSVIATDTYKIAGLMENVFKNPRLLSANTVDLLTLVKSDSVAYSVYDTGVITFSASDIVVYSSPVEGLEEFAIKEITNLLNITSDSYCEVAKDDFLQLLDRLSLFVSPYDKNAINLTFAKDGIIVTSKSISGMEIIPYVSIHDYAEFSCAVDIQMLQSQVKGIPTSTVNIYYGHPNALKLKTDKLIQIIGLLEE